MELALMNGTARIMGSQLNGNSSRVYASQLNGNSSRIFGSQLNGMETTLELINEILWNDSEQLNGLFDKARRQERRARRQNRRAANRAKRSANKARRQERKDIRLANLKTGNRTIDKAMQAVQNLVTNRSASPMDVVALEEAGIDAPIPDIIENGMDLLEGLSLRSSDAGTFDFLGQWWIDNKSWAMPVGLGVGFLVGQKLITGNWAWEQGKKKGSRRR